MLLSAIAKQYKARQTRNASAELPLHSPPRTTSPSPRTTSPPALRRVSSPTPDEQRLLDDNGRHNPLDLFKRENWLKLALVLFILTIFVLVNVFEKPIIHALEPATDWMRRTPATWLIPIAILIVLSMPPLFGQEIVLMFIGVTWGPGIGMAIGTGGTILGELGTFYLFKYVLQRRAARYEEKNVRYAVLAHVIREGGVKVATIARWSVIPNHLLTALFATCGMSLTTFLISAVLSLPNTFVNIYFGYALAHSSKTSSIVNDVDIAVLVLVTMGAGRYMRKLQNDAKVDVIRARCERREAAQTSTESLKDARPHTLTTYPPA